MSGSWRRCSVGKHDFADVNREPSPDVVALQERLLKIREKARRRDEFKGWQERLEDRQAS